MEGSFWGAPRTSRSVAVSVVDALNGYTIEFASDPAFVRDQYNRAEAAILRELDCEDVPTEFEMVLQAQVSATAPVAREDGDASK